MAGFEDLIRGALEKQGKPEPARREAIYASSRTALGRMLAQNDKLDAAAIALQEERLETAIKTIEADYVKRDPQPAPEPEPPADKPAGTGLTLPPEAAEVAPSVSRATPQVIQQSLPRKLPLRRRPRPTLPRNMFHRNRAARRWIAWSPRFQPLL